MSRLPIKLSFNQFFGVIVLSVILASSGIATAVHILHGFRETKTERETSQQVVANLLVDSLRAPLIQGSFIEAKLRANPSKPIPRVTCVSIKVKNEQVASCDQGIAAAKEVYSVVDYVYFDEGKTQIAAEVQTYFNNSDIYAAVKSKILFAVVLNLILALIVTAILLAASAVLRGELNSVLSECTDSRVRKSLSKNIFSIYEFSFLRDQMITHMAAAQDNAETRAAGDIARQVKHDIRSPLAALNNIALSISKNLTENQREVLFGVIQSIVDIANDVTQKRPKQRSKKAPATSRVQIPPIEIEGIVRSLVAEKEIESNRKGSVFFEVRSDHGRDPLFTNVCPTKLKRSLSNVLNNSIDAMPDGGCITIDVKQTSKNAIISIVDTGVGIQPDLLPSLGQKGKTVGKTGGSGLGLYYANKCVNEVGGSLTVYSDGISGTSVVFEFPLGSLPSSHVQSDITGQAAST